MFYVRGRSNNKRPTFQLDLPILASYLSPDVVCNLWLMSVQASEQLHKVKLARFQVTFDYLLKLAAMTYEAKLLIAIVVGLDGGHPLFNVFAPVGESSDASSARLHCSVVRCCVEGPARAAAHARRRASVAGSAVLIREHSWFCGRAASSGLRFGSRRRGGRAARPRHPATRRVRRHATVERTPHRGAVECISILNVVVWQICIIIHSKNLLTDTAGRGDGSLGLGVGPPHGAERTGARTAGVRN